jgi:hypothetical protein
MMMKNVGKLLIQKNGFMLLTNARKIEEFIKRKDN